MQCVVEDGRRLNQGIQDLPPCRMNFITSDVRLPKLLADLLHDLVSNSLSIAELFRDPLA